MMYQTFCVAFDYLASSGKIVVRPKDDKVFWVWDDILVKRILTVKRATVMEKDPFR